VSEFAAQPTNRWQRRRDRTRRALMAAALDLFRAKGYDATTIEEITDAADVSPRTFFYYFKLKEEVLFSGHRERRDELIDVLRSRLDDQPIWPAICAAMLTIVDAFEADPSFFRERAELYASEPALRSAVLRINDELVENMAEVLAERLQLRAREELLPRLVATLANGALRCAIDCWVSTDDADLRTLATEALETVRPAIAEAPRR
jgi:AcrR family transcriptional regulator